MAAVSAAAAVSIQTSQSASVQSRADVSLANISYDCVIKVILNIFKMSELSQTARERAALVFIADIVKQCSDEHLTTLARGTVTDTTLDDRSPLFRRVRANVSEIRVMARRMKASVEKPEQNFKSAKEFFRETIGAALKSSKELEELTLVELFKVCDYIYPDWKRSNQVPRAGEVVNAWIQVCSYEHLVLQQVELSRDAFNNDSDTFKLAEAIIKRAIPINKNFGVMSDIKHYFDCRKFDCAVKTLKTLPTDIQAISIEGCLSRASLYGYTDVVEFIQKGTWRKGNNTI